MKIRALLLSGAAVVVLAAGCGGTSTAGSARPVTVAAPVFDSQANAKVACMAHQTATPTSAYRVGSANTAELLTMLRYYTANGARAYCDGRGPTATDRQWLKLYLAAGASPAHVAPWLPALKAA